MTSPTADEAEGHLRRRAQVVKHLARLADLLGQWDDWEADRLLPPKERRFSRPPGGSRATIETLHHALFSELHDLDAAAARGNETPATVGA